MKLKRTFNLFLGCVSIPGTLHILLHGWENRHASFLTQMGYIGISTLFLMTVFSFLKRYFKS